MQVLFSQYVSQSPDRDWVRVRLNQSSIGAAGARWTAAGLGGHLKPSQQRWAEKENRKPKQRNQQAAREATYRLEGRTARRRPERQNHSGTTVEGKVEERERGNTRCWPSQKQSHKHRQTRPQMEPQTPREMPNWCRYICRGYWERMCPSVRM